MGRGIHLVGSVPMANAQVVFETVSATLGHRIKRLPDGETGERLDWITWLEPIFANNPALERSDEFFRVHATGTGRHRYTLKAGAAAESVRFDDLFYADIATQSYAVFRKLRDAGRIPAGTKFQVDLVPAHSVIWLFLVDRLHAPIDPIYNAAVKREIDKIAAAIPHDDLAIQFDVASAVFARLERNEPSSYGRSKAEMQETFSSILVDRAAGAARPHAGAAQPQRRRLFRAAAKVTAQAGNGAVPRPRAPHRRGRRQQAAPRHRKEIRERFLDRDRMRFWPARPEHHSRAAAHPCRARGHGLTVKML